MWTPKRIVLLAAGFVAFFSSYAVYANFLGGIDGLPPLPECYLSKAATDGAGGNSNKPKLSPLEDKLRQAFGPDCQELNWPIKLELHSKRMVLAARDFSIEPDGKVHLKPLSLGLFGAEKGDGRGLEINTLSADQAYLTFDRPIGNIGEIGSRKIVFAELLGGNLGIKVTNNHRTPNRDDDLHVDIKNGPLYYDESKHLIWTKDDVRLKDYQSKPKPTEINGHAMDMELVADPPPAKPGAPRKPKGDSVTGVKSIVLHSDVVMNLYVDGQSGFPGAGRDQAAAPRPAKPAAGAGPTPPPEKAHVCIRTPGKFRYEVFKDYDTAHFDVPEEGLTGSLKQSPQDVTATRIHESLGTTDQLVCKHLELRLRRKEAPAKGGEAPPADASSPEKSLEIETAHATGPDGLVILTSDSENLTAKGCDFFYDAPKMLTILKGQPMMEADKDHNVIRARELHIVDHKPDGAGGKAYQTATGIGPGTVDLMDKNATPYRKMMRASWRDTLVSTKDGPHDLLIFTGNANFLDYEHNQTLSADTLKVWLQPKEADAPGTVAAVTTSPAGPGQPAPQKSPRPDHLEAITNVSAHSAEMNIHDTGRLVVWFKDVPVDAKLPAAVAAVAAGGVAAGVTPAAVASAHQSNVAVAMPASMPRPLPAGPVVAKEPAPPAAGQRPAQPGAGHPGATAPPVDPTFVGPPKPPAPPRPIDLSARSIEAWVLRSDVRNTLDKLWTEGNVRVKQAPASPDEKGVDIEGDTLQMDYHVEGNFLVVTGDLAKLRMDKIYIIGPEVNIDQATNKAWVTGAGAMEMESKTNFQGDQLNKPVPLTVVWHKSMLFDGNYAEFHEAVQAEQENAHLLSQRLEVHFDRAISLKEGAKGDQPPARVQHLVCDRNVSIEERTFDPAGKLIKFQNLISPWVTMTALEAEEDFSPPPPAAPGTPPAPANTGNEVRATGPGTLRIMQVGGADPADPIPLSSGPANRPPAPGTQPPAPNTQPPARTTQPTAPGTQPPAPTGAKAPAKPPEQMKLTYVSFEKSMYANSKKNKADFYENVRVLNFPCTNPEIRIDIDAMLESMPEGGIYLRCDQLEVLNRAPKGSKAQQEMTAVGHVTVQSKAITGHSAKVTYNEEKDQLIFDGGADGYATLYKSKASGAEPEKIEGKKITYIRKTGEYKVDDGRLITGN